MVQSAVTRFLDVHPNIMLLSLVLLGGTGGAVVQPFVLSSEYEQDYSATAGRLSNVEHELCLFRREQTKANNDQTVRQLNALIWDLERAITDANNPAARDVRMLNDARADLGNAEAERRALYDTMCVRR
jgi:hypothetical protein